jgi:hypothetical protein
MTSTYFLFYLLYSFKNIKHIKIVIVVVKMWTTLWGMLSRTLALIMFYIDVFTLVYVVTRLVFSVSTLLVVDNWQHILVVSYLYIVFYFTFFLDRL